MALQPVLKCRHRRRRIPRPELAAPPWSCLVRVPLCAGGIQAGLWRVCLCVHGRTLNARRSARSLASEKEFERAKRQESIGSRCYPSQRAHRRRWRSWRGKSTRTGEGPRRSSACCSEHARQNEGLRTHESVRRPHAEWRPRRVLGHTFGSDEHAPMRG